MIDPDWPTEEDKPWVIARKRFGHITIANSDAARRAYTDAAIDQAHRGAGTTQVESQLDNDEDEARITHLHTQLVLQSFASS